MENLLLFRPPSPPSYDLESFGNELTSFNGTLCLCLPSNVPSSYIIIYCHGSTIDIGHCQKFLRALATALSFHVIILEYPGFGPQREPDNSDKLKPTEGTVNQALENVFTFVNQQLEWPKERIILIGRSVGSGPTIELASKETVGGLVLLAPFTSIKDAARHRFWKISDLVLPNIFNNLPKMALVKCPVACMHGTEDRIIPLHHSESLIAAATGVSNEKKTLVRLENMGHNGYDWNPIIHAIRQFFTQNGL
ncbi:unnamed protein product, partial [Heterosigma akashiwo]